MLVPNTLRIIKRQLISLQTRITKRRLSCRIAGLLLGVLLLTLSACTLLEDQVINNTDLSAREAGQPRAHAALQSAGHAAEITHIFPLFSAGAAAAGEALTIGRDGAVLKWTLSRQKAQELQRLSQVPQALSFCPKNFLLAVAQPDGIHLIDLKAGVQSAHLTQVKSRVNSLDFDAACNSLVIGAADSRVYRWRFNLTGDSMDFLDMTPQRRRAFESYIGHAAVVNAVVYHPGEHAFFSADWSGNLSAWLAYDADKFGGRFDRSLFSDRFFADQSNRQSVSAADGISIEHLRISGDGKYLALGTQDGDLQLWQVRGLSKLSSVKAHGGHIYDVALSPAAAYAASAGRDGKIKCFKLDSKRDPLTGRSTVEFSPVFEVGDYDGRSLAFISEDVLLVGTADGRLLQLKLKGQK